MASSGSRPVVGLTTYLERARCQVWDTDFALLPHSYVAAVAGAGGVPVLLPPVTDGVDELLGSLDALVLSGGADLDPSRYGQPPHPATRDTRPGRDEAELQLLRGALERDLPVLCICRGTQLLNVALGGSLAQHLPDVVGHDRHRPRPGVFGTVPVTLQADSRVGAVLGTRREVPCHHHQALDRLAPGLDVVAWAEDGTVEAVELRDRRFVLGVQWHPEEDRSDVRLFEALVAAARPAEARPAVARPAVARPAEASPAEVRPAEVRPAEVRP